MKGRQKEKKRLNTKERTYEHKKKERTYYRIKQRIIERNKEFIMKRKRKETNKNYKQKERKKENRNKKKKECAATKDKAKELRAFQVHCSILTFRFSIHVTFSRLCIQERVACLLGLQG